MRQRLIAVLLVALANACAEPQPTAKSSSGEATATHTLQTFTSDATGFDTHSHWLDTGREVVVFDAQFTPAYAKQLVAEIRKKTTSPIKWVVVTHPNPDKFNGVPVFQELGAKVVASASTARAIPGVHAYKKAYFVNVAKAFTDATYPAEPKIDVTFERDHELPLDGPVKVRLHELSNRGVSSTQTVAFVPSANALVVGDLVHHRAHAWLEGGISDGKPSPDLAAWSRALEELRAYPKATVYGGRGENGLVEDVVPAERAYLDGMKALVTKYVTDLGPAKNELAGPNASKHHAAIAALAAKQWPTYALPYMIEYGVYGLVAQVAAGKLAQ